LATRFGYVEWMTATCLTSYSCSTFKLSNNMCQVSPSDTAMSPAYTTADGW
jgi:hypothetical protein